MKALALLREISKDSKLYLKSFGENGTVDEDFIDAQKIYNKVNEAIKELEEINKKIEATKEFLKLKLNGVFDEDNIRSCENCKYFGGYTYETEDLESFINASTGCRLFKKRFDDTFCCNKWQEK